MKKNTLHRPRLIAFALLTALFLSGCTGGGAPRELRCENLVDPLSTGPAPRLSWKNPCNGQGDRQTAYRILAATAPELLREGRADLWDSGKVPSGESVLVDYAGEAPARERLIYWCVRVWNADDRPSAWSEAARFGTGWPEQELRTEALYIGYPAERGNPQSPLLRRRFESPGGEREALLYINSLGYHEIYINGMRVGDEVLAPAVSQLSKRSLYCTYDVRSYLHKGENDLVIWLGQGWYRPGLWEGACEGPLAKVSLYTRSGEGWSPVLRSDASWEAAPSGYTSIGSWRPGQFYGECVDGSAIPESMSRKGLDALAWSPVAVADVPEHAVSPQLTEGNLLGEAIHAESVRALGDTAWIVDMGRAFTGWVDVAFGPLQKGQQIVLSYADHLTPEGDLYNQRQLNRYIASGRADESFESKFNYQGLQYIKITGLNEPPTPDRFVGYPIRTGFARASSFECSDSDLNAIHDMIAYTLCNLSLGGYLVDCPQLERLGYGGDGNASTQSAQTMFDLGPLYANWMQAWEDSSRPNGDLPHTAPNPYSAGGGPYWCGFVITANWRTYVNYGDIRALEAHYPMMRRWLGFVESHSADGLLRPWPAEEGFRNWYLGDWATPAGIVDPRPAESIDVVNNSFICICYQTMEKIATLLGRDDDARLYAERNARLQERIQQEFYRAEGNFYATGTQIDNAFPMLAGVTPPALAEAVAGSLYAETRKLGGHIGTGLVGIPVLVEWAVRNNRPDFIYGMLKKRTLPGYLYMLDNGATTTWEHWEGTRSRIHNCYNGIGSWFYEAIGGIRPDEGAPGYRRVLIRPQVPAGVTWAKVTKETPYGRVAVDWELTDGTLSMALSIPPGSEGVVALPAAASEYTLDGRTLPGGSSEITLGSGKHTISYPL